MIQELDDAGIEALLHEEVIARIAYLGPRGFPSIATIAYGYDGSALYGYSLLGGKVEAMSARPEVCVAVDRIYDNADWRSVIACGVFEPLDGPAALDAVRLISDRLRTVALAETASDAAAHTYVAREGGPGIAYRIRITEKHGRTSTPRGALT